MEIKKLYGNFQAYLQINLPMIKWVFLFGVLFYAVFYFFKVKGCAKKYRKKVASMVYGSILSLNCSFIFVMTLFGRRIRESRKFDLKPFESYYYTFAERDMEMLLQILMNIAMYIPLGFLLPCCFKLFEKYRYIIFTAVISAAGIEFIQVIFKIGLFEVDDIINNTLGATLGVAIYELFHKFEKSGIGKQKEL